MPVRFSSLAAVPIALVFAPVLTAAAHADLKVVQKVTTGGTGMAMGQSKEPKTASVTVYYKGSKSRYEQSGSVLIYDAATKKVISLDPATKTYRQLGMGDSASASPITFESTATFTKGGQTRTIGGKVAKNYIVKGTLLAKPPASANGKAANRQRFTMQLESELWTTEAIKGVSTTQAAPEMGIASAIGSGMKPLMDKFAQVKGVTLASTQKMTIGMSGSASSGASTMGTTTVKTELVSLSEAPLPDALFAIPKGYTLGKTVSRPRPAGSMRPGVRTTP